MARTYSAKTSTGLTVVVVKDYYSGLWNVKYEDGGQWAGPYKTRKEAIERMCELCTTQSD